MEKVINACLWFVHLPRTIKAAMVKALGTVVIFGFVLGALDAFQEFVKIDGFWKIRAGAWLVYWLTLGVIARQVYVKWHDGSLYDEVERKYSRRRRW